ncbi:hypothetical protein BC831DRAFT_443528 [Entophlyctis helioformis]|nr:hypothetical protein BC831DRAFT_443528 [Entophlyctis helioformis]
MTSRLAAMSSCRPARALCLQPPCGPDRSSAAPHQATARSRRSMRWTPWTSRRRQAIWLCRSTLWATTWPQESARPTCARHPATSEAQQCATTSRRQSDPAAAMSAFSSLHWLDRRPQSTRPRATCLPRSRLDTTARSVCAHTTTRPVRDRLASRSAEAPTSRSSLASPKRRCTTPRWTLLDRLARSRLNSPDRCVSLCLVHVHTQ